MFNVNEELELLNNKIYDYNEEVAVHFLLSNRYVFGIVEDIKIGMHYDMDPLIWFEEIKYLIKFVNKNSIWIQESDPRLISKKTAERWQKEVK